MDTHVFASLAQVRILLVPVGPISPHSFEKYASEITSFDSIRLGDIPEATNDERGSRSVFSAVLYFNTNV